MTAVQPTNQDGPPPLFTDPAIHRRLMEAARTGMSWKLVADHARISRRTIYTWRERGLTAIAQEEAGQDVPIIERPYMELWREMLAARSDARVRVIGLVHMHAEDDPRTARWLAERLDREQFHIDQRLEVTGEGGGPVQHQVAVAVVQYDTDDQAKSDALLVALAETGVLEVPDDGQPTND